MSDLDLALMERRSERMLNAFDLTVVVVEPICRERRLMDDIPFHTLPNENVELTQMREKYREVER